jgi:hypothetical protein
LTALATILLFSSCQKEFKNPEPPPDQAIFLTNDKDKQNVLNIKEVSQILKEVYKNPKFFALNRTNLKGEIYNNWPVRERYGDVSFTFNDRTFY